MPDAPSVRHEHWRLIGGRAAASLADGLAIVLIGVTPLVALLGPVERFVAGERIRMPAASEAALLQSALDRWQRDRRCARVLPAKDLGVSVASMPACSTVRAPEAA